MLLRTKISKLVLINVIIYLFLTAEIRCAVKNKDLATKGASRFGAALGAAMSNLAHGLMDVMKVLSPGVAGVLEEFTSTLVDSMHTTVKKDKRK
ncbi:hypothetical protein TNCT_128861 [Trichonephila clavata]|uniref:Uncharacterized protein n=2 Tax=Trichonephila TaxID=2585208 RepID=A0A8X6HZ23_TRICU|nr:hypothetical protein TNCT_128861 [Trichonephila clavata]